MECRRNLSLRFFWISHKQHNLTDTLCKQGFIPNQAFFFLLAHHLYKVCSILKDLPAFSINPQQHSPSCSAPPCSCSFSCGWSCNPSSNPRWKPQEWAQQLLWIQQHTWTQWQGQCWQQQGWHGSPEWAKQEHWVIQAGKQAAKSQAHVRDHTKAAQKGLVATAGLFSENMRHTLQLWHFTDPCSFYLATRLPFYCLLGLEQKKSVFLFNQIVFIWTNGEVKMLWL